MNDRETPPRFPGSGAPDLLRDAMTSARADVPDAAQLARLAARLPLGAPPPGGSGAPATPAVTVTAPPSVLSGALVGAALGVLVAGAGLVWDATRASPSPPASSVPVVSTSANIESPPPAAAPPPSSTSPLAPAVTASPAPAPRASAPVAHASAVTSAVAVDPTPSSGSLGTPPVVADGETEAHLLQRAHEALGGSPAQALALTQEHASRFPGGSLAQEREVVAIQALLRLGRADEARARAARFFAAFPSSAHRRRIEALLGP
jgi:hypothetical protein